MATDAWFMLYNNNLGSYIVFLHENVERRTPNT